VQRGIQPLGWPGRWLDHSRAQRDHCDRGAVSEPRRAGAHRLRRHGRLLLRNARRGTGLLRRQRRRRRRWQLSGTSGALPRRTVPAGPPHHPPGPPPPHPVPPSPPPTPPPPPPPSPPPHPPP